MPYRIEVEQELGFIRLHYSGEVSLDQRIFVLNELCIEYNVFDRFRFLIDVRTVSNVLEPAEQELLGKYIASREEFVHAKIVVLAKPDQTINKALLEKATQSGLKNRVFDNEQEAAAWLVD